MLKNKFDRARSESFLSIGTMSGTSMDGIDVALIKTDGYFKIEELGHFSLNYTIEFHQLLKVAEYLVCSYEGDLSKALRVDFAEVFEEYFLKVMRTSKDKALEALQACALYLHKNVKAAINLLQIIEHSTFLHSIAIRRLMQISGYNFIDVIGSHGQTLFHNPGKKITVQVGDAQELANRLNTMIISDFRSLDVALGGQGAPLAPLYHLGLAVRDQKLPLAVVNCGGIANISLILTSDYKDLKGYDTGPGNGLIDLFVKQRTKFTESMDHNGKYALKGKVHAEILDKLYAKAIIINGQNYFDLPPPKSLDLNNLKLIEELDDLSLEDGCATLAAFTADSIIKNLEKFTDRLPKHWVLVGGGWYNPAIKRELEQRIKTKLGSGIEHKILLAQEAGWNNKAIEAQIFAYLAIRVLKGLPISIKETTGVSKPITLAKLTVSNVEHSITRMQFSEGEQLRHYSMVCQSLNHLLLQEEQILELEGDPFLLIILNNIAEIYRYLNRNDKAIEYYKKTDIELKRFDNLIKLGLIHQKLSKNLSTLIYYEKALNVLKGTNHPQTFIILTKIAEVYISLNLDELAIDYYEDAIKFCRKIYGNTSLYIGSILDKIADLYNNKAQYQLAIKYYNNALNIFKFNYRDYEQEGRAEINNILNKCKIIDEDLQKGEHNYDKNHKKFGRKYSL